MGADPYDWYINGGSSGNGSGMIDIGTVNGGTVYGSDSNGSWWDNWGDNIFAIGSQIIGAWGRNPTQQIGSGQVGGIGGGYSPAAIQQQIAAQQAALAAQANNRGGTNASGGVGSTVGGGLDGVIDWATKNPLPVFLGIAGVFLLFKSPPGRR